MPSHLVDDPRADAVEHRPGELGDVRGHPVERLHRADHARPFVRAVVAHDPDALHREQHREALPDRVVETRRADLGVDDRVRFPEEPRRLFVHGAEDPHGETGTGERLAAHARLAQTELAAEPAHLVLEQLAQRLDELHVHPLGETAHVVVALDRRRRTLERDRLDHVRVERPLRQEADRTRLALERLGLVLEDADERLADDLPLPLGVGHAVERLEEPLARVDDAHAEVLELGLDGRALALPQEAVVDEHAVEPGAERLMEERRDDGGVDATGERAEDVLLPDLVADGIPSVPRGSSPSSSRGDSRTRRTGSSGRFARRSRCGSLRDGTGSRIGGPPCPPRPRSGSSPTKRWSGTRAAARRRGRRGSSTPCARPRCRGRSSRSDRRSRSRRARTRGAGTARPFRRGGGP